MLARLMVPLVTAYCIVRYGALTAEELTRLALSALGRGDRERFERLKSVCIIVHGAESYVSHGRAFVIERCGKDPQSGQVIEAESYAVH